MTTAARVHLSGVLSAVEQLRRWLGMACFFAFCWLAVFNTAFMNGDDVVHYASSLQSSLWPRLHSAWTPNRVVDTYGRSLLSSVFAFLYFSINAIGHVGFLTLYKAVSASLFAAIAVVGLGYLLRRLPEVQGGLVMRWAFALLMAVLFFQLLGWRNQVHFICYQLPALLAFVLLRTTVDARAREMDSASLSGFVLLSYLCAFSLESIAATIFVFNALLLVIEWQRSRGKKSRDTAHSASRTYRKLILINMGFSASALVVTLLFSERSRGVVRASYLAGLQQFLSPGMALVGVALVLSGVGLLALRRRSGDAARVRFVDDLLFAVGLAAATWVTTYVASVKANTNYFDLVGYPWGDLMLTGKIAVLYAVGLMLVRATASKPRLQPVLALLLVIAASRLVHAALERVHDESVAAMRVEKVYTSMTAATDNKLVTGLQLDAIPMQTRPFPTSSSPDWFVHAYRETFRKYCGMETLPTFE